MKNVDIFPGDDALVYFSGKLFCPPALGNFTYGYIGRGVGIPLWMLQGGSAYAAITGLDFSDPGLHMITGEGRGQFYTLLGYEFHRYQHTRIGRHTSLWRWL